MCFTPGFTSCLLMPDRSMHRLRQNSISSKGPKFSPVSTVSWALSTSFICRVQWIMEAARERTKPLAFLCSTPQLCPSLFPLHSPPNPTPVPASGLPPTSPLGALTHGRCQPLTLQSLYQIFVFNHRLRLHVHGLCRDVENSVPLQFVPSI